MDVFEFMAGSPWLTFFLAAIIGGTLVGIAQAIMRVPECKCAHEVCNEDDP